MEVPSEAQGQCSGRIVLRKMKNFRQIWTFYVSPPLLVLNNWLKKSTDANNFGAQHLEKPMSKVINFSISP